MTAKEAYEIMWHHMKKYYSDNKELHNYLKTCSQGIAKSVTLLFAYQGYVKSSEANADPEQITREAIVNRLKKKLISASTDKEFLELTRELNKMEDNYKTADKETSITLNIIDYSNVSDEYIASMMPTSNPQQH